MNPAQRSLYGRIGAAIARSRHDPRDLTANARRAFLGRFESAIRAEYPDLPEPEIEPRAGELRRAHMLALAARSSVIRSQKKAASSIKADGPEVDRRDRSTPTAAA